MTTDLTGISVFLAVAEMRSFRAAAQHLGVTRPAVSQTIRRLEDRLGVALVQRTTRSVSLTEAGEQLFQRVAPAIAEVGLALDATADRDSAPSGLLRLAVSSIAERFISGPLLADFADAYPAVQIDVTVTDEEFDIVAEGYDAGVRLGEVIDQDMIAIPVSGEQRQTAVAAPAYIERFGKPSHPSELVRHRCIGWRPAPRVAPYRWEFGEEGREYDVAVNPEITTNDMYETFRPFVSSGQLVPLLEDYCPTFAGFFLYFPNRRNLAPKLRALVDHVKWWQ
jgi:DNA-binding transcriptional LysR family regulator